MGYFGHNNDLAPSTAAGIIAAPAENVQQPMDCSESSSDEHMVKSDDTSTSVDTAYYNNVITPKEVFECDVCHKVHGSKELLIRCVLKHERRNPLICLRCGKKFTKMSHARIHHQMHLNRAHRCPNCPKTFSRYIMLEVHRLGHL